jgi:signal transduction histidine kinase
MILTASLLLASILASVGVGALAYRWSAEAITAQVQSANRVLSATLRLLGEQMIEVEAGATPPQVLEAAWAESGAAARGRFLSFIGDAGRVLLHTGEPALLGADVSATLLPATAEHPSTSVRELLAQQASWSGESDTATQPAQVVAYSYSPRLGGLVAVHVPKPALDQELRAGSLPWALGLGGVTLAGLPLAFGVLHLAYRRQLRATERAESRRRSLEIELAHAHRLEAIGRLAGGVAHDINNVLTVILSYAEILREEATTSEQQSALSGIDEATARAAELTRQLLAFGRQQLLRPVALDVPQLLAELRGMFEHLAGAGIALHVDVPETLPAARVDRAMLERVLTNLVVNARDALARGGTIVIRAHDQPPAGHSGDWAPGGAPRVTIEVCDDGVGMDDATRAHAFEPFFTTKAIGQGTGLGLAMVHGAVTQAGGAVELRSAPGHGTTVSITLPAVNAEAKAPPPWCRETARPGAAKILVVEDEGPVRNMIQRALHAAGYDVATATDGVDALARIDRWGGIELDLVIADVRMPHMDGIELAKHLRQRRADMRVLFITGFTAVHTLGRISGDPVLHKPFSLDELLGRVSQLVGPGAPRKGATPRAEPYGRAGASLRAEKPQDV